MMWCDLWWSGLGFSLLEIFGMIGGVSFRGGYNICFDGVFILCWEEGGMILERIISALTLWFSGLWEMRSW